MEIVPSIDLKAGRSRLVWWPGASTGVGTPTDRPAVIAGALATMGAPSIHLVDLDGAAQGRPVNLESIGSIARTVAKPLQLAGGVDGPEQIEIAYAAGATRAVMPLWAVAEDQALLVDCLRIGGDWLAVGLDARPESLQGYPWRHRPQPQLDELVRELHGNGVQRFIFSHVTSDEGIARVQHVADDLDVEITVAGGVVDLDGLHRLRDAGASAVILGEAIFTGAIDLEAAARMMA